MGRVGTEYELEVYKMIIFLRYSKGLRNLKIHNDYWPSSDISNIVHLFSFQEGFNFLQQNRDVARKYLTSAPMDDMHECPYMYDLWPFANEMKNEI